MSIKVIEIEINDEEKVKDLINRICAQIESEIGTKQIEVMRITPNFLFASLNNGTITHGFLGKSIVVKFHF